jgi:hypothetical protein
MTTPAAFHQVDYSPVFVPGTAITLQAADTIAAGDPVEVAGSGTIQRAEAGSDTYIGVAGQAATSGGLVTVFSGKLVHEGAADGAIAAGDPLECSGLDGYQVKVAGGATPDPTLPSVIGLALTTAPDGADVRWLQY